VLSQLGRYPQAAKHQQGLLAAYLQVHGPRHPHTTVAAWNLMGTLDKLGKRGAARALMTRYLAWLLERHPKTLDPLQQEIRRLLSERLRGPEPDSAAGGLKMPDKPGR
jgi:hypothetical protein